MERFTKMGKISTKTALDVNLSFDQGDMVDRWIESVLIEIQY